MKITEEQAIQLSPDASSTKAGQKLATPAKWVKREVHEKAIWGDCQGSGKNPYRTMIDLTNIAFKCSCPSRKFPCKHGLGLLFLYIKSPEIFNQQSELAELVEEWLNKRNQREVKKKEKESKPVDAKAQAKRLEKRSQKVEGGISEINLWLEDLVRTGIASVPQQAYDLVSKIKPRMVDAQAPGLAARLDRMSQINFFKEGWQTELLREVSTTYLITTAYKNRETLSPDWQKEIRSLIGFNIQKNEVLAEPAVADQWLVLSTHSEVLDKLTVEKVWLYGKKNKKIALLLSFYARQQVAPKVFLSGSVLDADLCFYPGVGVRRALIKEERKTLDFFMPEAQPDLEAFYDQVSQDVSKNPFTLDRPFLIDKVKVCHADHKWYLQDKDQHTIVLENSDEEGWQMMAASFGRPVKAFVVYQQGKIAIRSIITDEHGLVSIGK